MSAENGRPYTVRSIGRRREDHLRARLAAIVTSSADAIIGATLDGIITDWNPAAERLFGYAAAEAIGQSLAMLIPSDQLVEAEAILARVRRGADVDSVETVRLTKDGRCIDVALTISPVWDETGSIIATSAIIRDISQRKAADAALAATHQRLREVLGRISDAVYAIDREWRFTYLNPAAERMMGRSRADLVGTVIWETLPDLVDTPLYAAYHEAVGEQRPVSIEFSYAPSQRWYEGQIYPAADGLSVVFHEITERKRLEAELHASVAQYRTLVEQLPAVVYVLAADDNQTGLYFSPKLEQVVHFTPEEALGRTDHWLGLVHPQDRTRVESVMTRAATAEEPYTLEYRHRRKDGDYIWVQDECVPIRDEAGRIVAWQGVLLDITPRVQAEQELAASERRFRTAFANAPIGMALVSLDGHLLQVNAALCEMLGYAAGELVGMSFQALLHPEDIAPSMELIRSVLAGERESYELEKRQLRRDGALLWTQVSISLVRDEAGAPGYLIAQVQDITERRRLTENLQASESQYRTLVELLPALVYTVAANDMQTPRYFSPYLETLTGYRPAEVLGRTHSWLETVHPEDRDRVAAEDARALATGEALRVEYRYRRKDGSYAWVMDESIRIRDEHGAVVSLHGVLLDITDRKQLEEDLRVSEEKYRTLVELLPAVVYIVSADDAGTPLYFSPYLETLTGYRPAEVLGRTHSWLENVHPEDRDRVAAEDGHAIATGTPVRIEYRCRRKDGSYAWVMDESIFLRDESGTIVALQGVLIDISDRKQAEAALAEALEAAQAATRTKSLFLAMMSHELRTPLQAVLGYADFLLHSSPDPLTPAQAEDIGTIHRGAERMVALIEQLLDLSRMEAGRLALESKPVDLTEILDHVRQDVAPQLAAKDLALHLAVPPTGFVALGDPERIRQILLNLVGNAVKFTEAGNVCINATTSADGIEVAVRDTGIGIAAEALPTIFEEFRQVEGALTRRYGGAGLGLAIAKKLADQMGGGITVESEPGVGSIFTLRLPAAPGF